MRGCSRGACIAPTVRDVSDVRTCKAPARMRSDRLNRADPAWLLGGAIIAGVAVVSWLSTGVEPSEVGRYLAYELAYVVMPGVVAYRALSRSPGDWLTQLAVGWALG